MLDSRPPTSPLLVDRVFCAAARLRTEIGALWLAVEKRCGGRRSTLARGHRAGPPTSHLPAGRYFGHDVPTTCIVEAAEDRCDQPSDPRALYTAARPLLGVGRLGRWSASSPTRDRRLGRRLRSRLLPGDTRRRRHPARSSRAWRGRARIRGLMTRSLTARSAQRPTRLCVVGPDVAPDIAPGKREPAALAVTPPAQRSRLCEPAALQRRRRQGLRACSRPRLPRREAARDRCAADQGSTRCRRAERFADARRQLSLERRQRDRHGPSATGLRPGVAGGASLAAGASCGSCPCPPRGRRAGRGRRERGGPVRGPGNAGRRSRRHHPAGASPRLAA